MTVVITVTVLRAIFLLNYPCVFTNTEVSHSSHFSYTFISLSLFFFEFLVFTGSLMGSIQTEISHTALKLHLDYHNLQKLEHNPKKIEKMEPHFSQRSSDSSKPLQSPRISFITGTATWSLIFFDGNHRALACIQHDKD